MNNQTSAPAPRFAIVEMMGHRRFGAKIEETTFMGAPALRCVSLTEPPFEEWITNPAAIFAVTICEEGIARAACVRQSYGGAYVPPEMLRALPAQASSLLRPADRWDAEWNDPFSGDDEAEIEEDGDGGRASDDAETPCSPRCVECPDPGEEAHHWMPLGASAEEDLPLEEQHPAQRAGCVCWLECKHCGAWREWTDADDDLSDLAAVPAPDHDAARTSGPLAKQGESQ